MKLSYRIMLTTFLFFLAGCGTLVTGFVKLEPSKYEQVENLHGPGLYFRHIANGSDIRAVGENRVAAVKILVKLSMEDENVCVNGYEVLDDSLVFFEGGSSSVYIKCR